MILAQIVTIPLNLFTLGAIALAFVYLATRIGAEEHTGWLFSKEMFMVLLAVVVLFCIGLDGQGIWHLLATVAHK